MFCLVSKYRINGTYYISRARICMQQQFFFLLLHPNGVLVCNVHDLYYYDKTGTIFILHVFEHIDLNAYFAFLV